MSQLKIENFIIDLQLKSIKHMYLRIHPRTGEITLSAPIRCEQEAIYSFIYSKLDWIKSKKKAFAPPFVQGYLHDSIFWFQGNSYRLHIVEKSSPPRVTVDHGYLVLQVRPSSSLEQRKAIMEKWCRKELKKMILPMASKWEKNIGVQAEYYGIKKMYTRWGSCNTVHKRIWINLALVEKPPICLEYIIVHELVHLLERSHNARFKRLMSQFMPDWKQHRDLLRSCH